ncbi:AraC family transcriptional regulator [Chryseobacterium gallinarum]|uniref:helix-turn-helix domain-containing protein n=1 Tax=Chryseobacterium gallinarum TaxID=1324352 RepID=UPI0020249BA9|nr:AraC family transcriptional regulator [Chryseobacterium gallinarum]MCL8538630.1 AraC family transcriptional regulator [Chryseobacterium gallinarum]
MKRINPPVTKVADDAVAYKFIKGIDNYNKTIKCTYFIIVLFTEGSGTHFIDEHKFPIHKNQLHFLFPGQHHHWVTGPETVAHKIVVGQKIFESFSSSDEFSFIRHNLNPVFKLSKKMFSLVNAEIKSFERDISFLSEEPSWKKIIQLRMDIVASMIRREAELYIKEVLLPKSNLTLIKYWELVNEQYIEQKAIKWYADKLGITPNYLNVLCRKHMNMTASDVIHYKIMQEAKKQLRFSNDSVKVITYNLGFDNISAFSAFFKRKSNFTPTEYRS